MFVIYLEIMNFQKTKKVDIKTIISKNYLALTSVNFEFTHMNCERYSFTDKIFFYD